MYLDGNGKVGQARVYRCPLCKDGTALPEVLERILAITTESQTSKVPERHEADFLYHQIERIESVVIECLNCNHKESE